MDLVDMTMFVQRRFPSAASHLPAPVRRRLRRLLPEGEAVRRFSEQVGTTDLPEGVQRIIERVWPDTMTSRERLAALISAVEYIVRNNVPGAIVECGLWKGGSLFAAVLGLQDLAVDDRDIFGFDTFLWMTKPSELDVDYQGRPWSSTWRETVSPTPGTSRQEVRNLLTSTRYPDSRVNLIAGRVEDTLPGEAPDQVALLRLDTDWYESTLHELEHLYPRLAVGGVLIIDDYGHFQGCRKAVDEYLANQRIFLHRIDYTGRIAVKQHEAGAGG